jgi:hypothetical protein
LLGQGGFGKVFKGYAVTTNTRIPACENVKLYNNFYFRQNNFKDLNHT